MLAPPPDGLARPADSGRLLPRDWAPRVPCAVGVAVSAPPGAGDGCCLPTTAEGDRGVAAGWSEALLPPYDGREEECGLCRPEGEADGEACVAAAGRAQAEGGGGMGGLPSLSAVARRLPAPPPLLVTLEPNTRPAGGGVAAAGAPEPMDARVRPADAGREAARLLAALVKALLSGGVKSSYVYLVLVVALVKLAVRLSRRPPPPPAGARRPPGAADAADAVRDSTRLLAALVYALLSGGVKSW